MSKFLAVPIMLLSSALHASVVVYDLSQASSASLSPSLQEDGFYGSNLTLTNDTGVQVLATSNLLLAQNWGSSIDPNKYFEVTLGHSSSYFIVDSLQFSLADTSVNPNFLDLRSSVDGFSTSLFADVNPSPPLEGFVTDYSVDLMYHNLFADSSGQLAFNSPITFRWYLTADSTNDLAGFVNCPAPLVSGCGFSGSGSDLIISAQAVAAPVPIPSAGPLFLMVIAACLGVVRRSKFRD